MILCLACEQNDESLFLAKVNEAKEYLNTKDSVTINIDSMTKFNWDHLLVIPPYSRLENLENKFGVNFNQLEDTGIETNDQKCILVFIEDEKIIKYFEILRGEVDFSSIASNKLFNRNETSFNIIKEKESIDRYRYFVKE